MSHKSHTKHSKYPPTVHPFMLAFSGYSGSGKTTLISKIISELSEEYSIAYFKHDAHQFEMDKEGKDTWQASRAGADKVLINDARSHVLKAEHPLDHWDQQSYFESADWVLVEGYKNSPLPKILVLDNQGELLSKYIAGEFENVKALVYPAGSEGLPTNLPRFSRDDVNGICDFVENYFIEVAQALPLYGLVLDGGRSTRMGKDKGALEYHGRPHNLFLAQQLGELCSEVFISRRPDQLTEGGFHGFKEIPDTFSGMGPLGGILSAQKAHPQAAFVVLACDLPFVDRNILEKLLHQRNPFRLATAFKSVDNDFPEPLCAIYEPKFFARALKFVSQGVNCPRKVLINSQTQILHQGEFNHLFNANSPEDLEHTKQMLKTEGA